MIETMRLLIFVVALSSFSCLGALRDFNKQQKRERAEAKAPPWAVAARKNGELGPGEYARLLAEAPKRAPQELLNILFCLEYADLAAVFLREAPAGTRREYLGDAFVQSLGASLNRVTNGMRDGLRAAATPTLYAGEEVPNCQSGPTWYEQVSATHGDADVYLWVRLELRPMPQCPPSGRGYHVTARWSSAYQRADAVYEADFCRVDTDTGKALAASVFAEVERAVRPTLPSAAERERLTPPYRWEWYLKDAELKGGGHGHHGD